MKALIYTGPKTLEFREMPDAVPAQGQSLVAVKAVGICGSDMHGYLGHDPRRVPPLVLGHEAAGEVIAGPLLGKRVTVNPLITCGSCRACLAGQTHLCPERQLLSIPPREGAFAELVAVPPENLVEVPSEVPLTKAALAEPLAVCWHAVNFAGFWHDGHHDLRAE